MKQNVSFEKEKNTYVKKVKPKAFTPKKTEILASDGNTLASLMGFAVFLVKILIVTAVACKCLGMVKDMLYSHEDNPNSHHDEVADNHQPQDPQKTSENAEKEPVVPVETYLTNLPARDNTYIDFYRTTSLWDNSYTHCLHTCTDYERPDHIYYALKNEYSSLTGVVCLTDISEFEGQGCIRFYSIEGNGEKRPLTVTAADGTYTEVSVDGYMPEKEITVDVSGVNMLYIEMSGTCYDGPFAQICFGNPLLHS